MADIIDITWEVADGYAGGARPQRTPIDLEDLLAEDTEELVRELIAEIVQDDFAQRIMPEWSSEEEDRVVEAWREARP